jgi:hypothetical protein
VTAGPDQAPAEVPGQLSPAVLDQLDGQLAARRADRRVEVDRAKAYDPRGCVDCGSTLSWLRVGVLGGWHQTSAGPRCHPCQEARGGNVIGGADDREARAQAIRVILGTTPAPARAGHGDRPARDFWHDAWLVERAGFRWFSETPGARPAPGAERFAYTSAAELLARLYPEPEPPKLERGPKCPRCKARDRWRVTERSVYGQPYTTGDKISPGYIEISRVCWGREGACRYEAEPEQRYEPEPERHRA